MRDSDSDHQTPPSYSTAVPAHIAVLFGKLPVLGTENRQAYENLIVELALEWRPQNTMEWLFVKDLADLNWEILRLRRAIASILEISFKEALAGVFVDVLPGYRRLLTLEGTEAQSIQFRKAEALADAWYDGPEEQERVKSELAKYGLDPEGVVGQAFVLRGAELEKMDRMLTAAEMRRTAVMHGFNEYRVLTSVRQSAVIDAKQVTLIPES
jgi:hypothetical protein